MLRWSALSALVVSTMFLTPTPPPPAVSDGPGFTPDMQLRYPANYREWVFLTSGLDMSYTAPAVSSAGTATPEHSVFNNTFVNPAAYRAYLATGHWPEGTVIVLENRGAEGNHSINVHGKTQSEELMGLEIHARDARLAGGWGFYNFENKISAKKIATTANCYSCHQQHAAVDTTFVQFYPTLMPVAKEKGTLSASFLKEEAAKKP